MQNTETLRRHAALVDRMADRLGVDLEDRVMRGALDPDQIPDLVLRCTACTNPEACERVLDTGSPLEAAPSYCVNAAVLEELARKPD